MRTAQTASGCGTNVLCRCTSYVYYYVLTIFLFLCLFPSFDLCTSTGYKTVFLYPTPYSLVFVHFVFFVSFVSCMHTCCACMCVVTSFYVMCVWMVVYSMPMLHTRMCSFGASMCVLFCRAIPVNLLAVPDGNSSIHCWLTDWPQMVLYTYTGCVCTQGVPIASGRQPTPTTRLLTIFQVSPLPSTIMYMYMYM